MTETDPAHPLVVTDDADLLDDLLRLAAAANVEVTVVHAAARSGRYWASAPLVVVGADLVHALARLEPADNPNVVVTSRGPARPDHSLYADALRVGARDVLPLPDAEARLADLLAESAERAPGHAPLVAVIGGRGGAGASLLAVSLALAGRRARLRTALLDADPLGGGLDLLLGAEHAPGSHWEEFSGRRGRMIWSALRDALPSAHGISLMTWTARRPSSPVPPTAMRAVLTSATRGAELVVADLPRSLDPSAEEVLRRSTVTLLVLPADVHSVVAAERIIPLLRDLVPDLRLVVRGASPATLSVEAVTESLGLPIAGELTDEPGLARLLDRGDTPARDPRSPLAAFGDSFVAGLRADLALSA
ncbi:septum site-determining protein Ssd [Actinorugispora endophytica]|uniref:Secretion/DNA translocation related CpaE-like protein n=1 Tax=Actinorugispora endophytica TaxID=1605990 RepID=A0A4R6V886_9ACTN|nr:septum site-determining protein Ssd [Actinorugispora endophytica]TDQ55349.1 secretion/DNA translocation related CpaE-like protein [Actinorugispora endophytica]